MKLKKWNGANDVIVMLGAISRGIIGKCVNSVPHFLWRLESKVPLRGKIKPTNLNVVSDQVRHKPDCTVTEDS